MRRIAAVLLLAVAACSTPPPAQPARGSGDGALATGLHDYVIEFLRRNPTTSTYLGGAGFDASLRAVDGTLRDHSVAALAAEDAWLDSTAATLEAMAADTLSASASI